jgi:hypothetical protein
MARIRMTSSSIGCTHTSVSRVLDDGPEGGQEGEVLGPRGDRDVHLTTFVVLCVSGGMRGGGVWNQYMSVCA